jgi:signal transduction histidine kinase
MTTTVGQPASSIRLQLWAALGEPRVRVAIALGGLVAAVGGGLLLATSEHLVDATGFGIQVGLMVIGTVAAGLVWLKRRPGNRVGALLLAFALVTATLALEGADDEILHSVGVAFEPVFFLLGYLVVFAFPEGRAGRAERLLLVGMVLYFLVGFVPWLFFSPVVSGGGPLFACSASCPANGLMIADRPEIAASLGTDLAWVVIALLTATIVLLGLRLATASRPRRRTLLPVYVPALVLSIPLLAFHGFAAGVIRFEPEVLSDLGWAITTARVAMPFGFLLAIAQASVFAGGALTRLMGQIGSHPSAPRLREIVAGALDDPSVELAFRVDGTDGFVDSQGEAVAGVIARDGRATSLVGRQGDTVAAIWHDPALNTDPELVNAASQAVLLALENGRLEAQLQARTDELAASRARMAAAGAAERRRVERDLHDGAQQQLVALQIKVALARELAPTDSEVAATLADVGYGLEDVLSDLREFAHGAGPPLLRNAGLRTAVASAAQRSVPPAAFASDHVARYSEEVETAVYFCCLEALQNVRKHAGPGAHAEVRISQRPGELCFEVVDDGIGCEMKTRRSAGIGLTNMIERIAALDGTLDVDSAVGRGTRVRGRIPLPQSTDRPARALSRA